MVKPATMPGSASGSSTLKTICQVLAPIACAASMRPWSTSRSEVSTSRAMKGAAASVSGTTAAAVPIDEPVMMRVNGMIATSRMMKGVERTALTMPPTTRLTPVFCSTPPRSVRRSNTPSGMPISEPARPEMPTITSVSHSELANSSSMAGVKLSHMGHLLHHHAGTAQLRGRRVELLAGAAGEHRQRCEGLALHLVDLAMHDAQLDAVVADHVGQQRPVGVVAGEGQPQQLAVIGGPCAHEGADARQHARGQRLRHDLLDQAASGGVLGAGEDVDHGSLFHDAAGVNPGHAVGHLLDHLHLVRDQHD